MKLELLKEPFPETDIEWRPQQTGIGKNTGKPYAMLLVYITSRAVMDRLDEVCGPENWKNEYTQAPNGGVLCGISVWINDTYGTQWVTKWDGAENTNVEAVKGGLSSAMKRSAVHWGIGRYLYKLPTTFATFNDYGKRKISIKNKNQYKTYKYDNPILPKEFLPKVKEKK